MDRHMLFRLLNGCKTIFVQTVYLFISDDTFIIFSFCTCCNSLCMCCNLIVKYKVVLVLSRLELVSFQNVFTIVLQFWRPVMHKVCHLLSRPLLQRCGAVVVMGKRFEIELLEMIIMTRQFVRRHNAASH